MGEQHVPAHSESMIERWPHTLMDNYGTPPFGIERASGVMIYDDQGRAHIDMLAGIAVNSLGYGHPKLVKAVSEQVANFAHVSNLFASAPALDVAETLIERFSCGDERLAASSRVFFCNSGAEANEAAFKIARLTGRRRILAAVNGFHGRTMGSLAMTGQPDKREPFAPLPSGVEFFPFGDADYLDKLVAVNPMDVAAIIVEPIQGETGIVPAPDGFLQHLRQLCDAHGILLICDEVQTGIGRTGDFFAHQHEAIVPDIVTMAKGLGGGLPIGAVLAHGEAAQLFTPGKHGTTFGGNPVACAAARAVLALLGSQGCANVKAKGALFSEQLAQLPGVDFVRGRGLMLGVVLEQNIAAAVVKEGYNQGVIMNAPAPNVLRLTPPLIITEAELSEAAKRIGASIRTVLDATADESQ